MSPEEKTLAAKRCNVARGYLANVCLGWRQPGPQLAKALVKVNKRFTLAKLRPDIWG